MLTVGAYPRSRRAAERSYQWAVAACRTDTYLGRALDESLLTAIYAATFAYWLQDASPGFEGSQRLLSRLLRLPRQSPSGAGEPPPVHSDTVSSP